MFRSFRLHAVPLTLAVAAWLAGSGCALEASFSDSHYACDPPSGACPPGYTCSDEGFCEITFDAPADAAETPDSPPGTPDAAPVPDSPPGTPDAAPPKPDATPPPPPDAAPPDAALPPPTTTSFTATRDTQLYAPDPTFNFGNFLVIRCNGNPDSPILFGFDVSSIPPGATVESAVLRLTTATVALSAGGVASVYALNEDWTEGTNDGTPGVANYNQRKTSTNWSTAGAKPPSRASSPAATFSPTTTNTGFNINLPASLVQGWVANPASNFGLIVTCPSNNAAEFETRAAATSSKRPKLTVTYRAP